MSEGAWSPPPLPPLKGFSWLRGSVAWVLVKSVLLLQSWAPKLPVGGEAGMGVPLGGVWVMITMCVLMGATSSNRTGT